MKIPDEITGVLRASLQEMQRPGKGGVKQVALTHIEKHADTPDKMRVAIDVLNGTVPEGESEKARVAGIIEKFRKALAGGQARQGESPVATAEEASHSGPSAAEATRRGERGRLHKKGEDRGDGESVEQLPDAYRTAAARLAGPCRAAHEEMVARLQPHLSDLRKEMAVRLTTLREEATAGLQPHLDAYAKCLNALVKGMPQGSIAEKRALRQWLNKEVSSRGLAVRCPNTGAPSLLQVDPGEYPEVGRFQFYHMEEGERVRTASRTRLPELQVILADLAVSLDLDPSLPGEVGPDDAGQEGDGWAASEDQRRDSRSPRNKP